MGNERWGGANFISTRFARRSLPSHMEYIAFWCGLMSEPFLIYVHMHLKHDHGLETLVLARKMVIRSLL